MATIFSFLLFMGICILLNRSMAWGRRALARHRQHWSSMGFVENNPAWRIRQLHYRRVALMAYVGFGIIVCLIANMQRGVSIPAVVFLAASLPAVPSYAVWYVYRTYKEWTEPLGEVAVAMVTNQWHRKIEPLDPKGIQGTAKLETPASIGLVNPLGWMVTRPQPIVKEVNQ